MGCWVIIIRYSNAVNRVAYPYSKDKCMSVDGEMRDDDIFYSRIINIKSLNVEFTPIEKF